MLSFDEISSFIKGSTDATKSFIFYDRDIKWLFEFWQSKEDFGFQITNKSNTTILSEGIQVTFCSSNMSSDHQTFTCSTQKEFKSNLTIPYRLSNTTFWKNLGSDEARALFYKDDILRVKIKILMAQ